MSRLLQVGVAGDDPPICSSVCPQVAILCLFLRKISLCDSLMLLDAFSESVCSVGGSYDAWLALRQELCNLVRLLLHVPNENLGLVLRFTHQIVSYTMTFRTRLLPSYMDLLDHELIPI